MACGNPRELLLPDVHLMLRGLSRRVRELGRGDRDMYACCYVGGESKWRGRLNWTVGRKAVAREARARSSVLDLGGEGVKQFETRWMRVFG